MSRTPGRSRRGPVRLRTLRLVLIATLGLTGLVFSAPALHADTYGEARTAILDGDYDDAIEIVTEAIRSGQLGADPEFSNALSLRGIAYYRSGEPEAAIADLESAVAGLSYDLRPTSLAILALAQADTGALDEALGTVEAALRIDPSEPFAYESRADINELAGRPDLAAADRERQSLNADLEESLTDRDDHWRLRLFNLYDLRQEDIDAIESTPASHESPYVRAIAGYLIGYEDPTKGLPRMVDAAEQSPGSAFPGTLLAIAYLKLGEVTAAEGALVAALSADPQDARTLLILSGVRALQGLDPADTLAEQADLVPLPTVIADVLDLMRNGTAATDANILDYPWGDIELWALGVGIARMATEDEQGASSAFHQVAAGKPFRDAVGREAANIFYIYLEL